MTSTHEKTSTGARVARSREGRPRRWAVTTVKNTAASTTMSQRFSENTNRTSLLARSTPKTSVTKQ